jgi:hypothetical protein
MLRNHRLLGAVFLGALGALLSTAGVAESASRQEIRARIRCEHAIVQQGLAYSHQMDWRVSTCLSVLSRCRMEGRRASSCGLAERTCAAVSDSMDALGESLRARVAAACAEIGVAGVLEHLGFRASMGDCEADSLDAFAGCLAANLRAAAADTVAAVEPEACLMVEEAGMAGVMPVDVCAAGGVDSGPAGSGEPAGPLFCGGAAQVACPDGYTCDRTDALCTQSDVAGMCVPTPEGACVDAGNPVCGCDGVTYPSNCDRLLAGAVRGHDGACDQPVQCSFAQPDCPSGFFCDFPAGDCGEGGTGMCRAMEDEPCNLCVAFVAAPVCGCDLVTYASECERHAAGVAKWFDGPCF